MDQLNRLLQSLALAGTVLLLLYVINEGCQR